MRRDPCNQATADPFEVSRFFDIYIQVVNATLRRVEVGR